MNSNEQFELAVKLISGDGVRKDQDEAMRLLTSAAHAGHIQSQGLLGSMLRSCGKIGEAVVWLRKAADSGDTDAQVEFGMVCVSSGEAYKDYKKANECWRAAARAGNGVAFANLAMLYGNGMGVKRSPTKAIFLLAAAVGVGNEPAKEIMAEFVPKLAEQSNLDAATKMALFVKKLDTLAASADRASYCSWAIDNLDSVP